MDSNDNDNNNITAATSLELRHAGLYVCLTHKSYVGSSGRSVSSPNVSTSSAQVVAGSYPNAWGLRKEVATAKESVSAPWSAPEAESKLAHASALEKITSGRWYLKKQIHSQMDVEVIKHQDPVKEFYYHRSTTVNDNVYNMPDVIRCYRFMLKEIFLLQTGFMGLTRSYQHGREPGPFIYEGE
ncbi:hypothetical protein CQW23_21842 [Capsicum baccatum]|uniref:Uncharacterized protein n=1 Tax=Capsicum baccatum TaxID=33114 RepID=A0A2G2VZA0_CAPBA|nr:hypothetical protein CQW23_21842 [Capsicum baccatum]